MSLHELNGSEMIKGIIAYQKFTYLKKKKRKLAIFKFERKLESRFPVH